jgi:HNH endonuclease/NUMOD4 motif
MDEIWKSIPNHPLYLVSNKGRIASIMVLQYNNAGRHIVHLTTGSTKGRKGTGRLPKKMTLVHRAVLEAFVGPPPTSTSVCRHRNDVPNDNRLENLEWGTKSDNAKDALRNGRWPINEDAGRAVLSNKDVTMIRTYYDRMYDLNTIAAAFKISASHVYGIGKRRFWKHLPEDPVFDEVLEMEYELTRCEFWGK